MFLNNFGQPLILSPHKKYGPYEQHNGPLLLTQSAFKEHVVPANWCGYVVGSLELYNSFCSAVTMKEDQNVIYRVLIPNEPADITYNETNVELTLITAGQCESGQEANIYLLRNNCVNVLITDNLSGYLDFLPKAGAYFQSALRQGIDVMYVDDELYRCGDEALETEQHERIVALLGLIKPKHVYGLRAEELPKCLQDMCLQRALCPPP